MIMPAQNNVIGDCLREILNSEGYKLNTKTGLGKLGPDIKASKDGETYYIEVIESEEAALERVKDFYEAFFQAVSRLNNRNCDYCVIAMQESSRKSLPIKAKLYKVAWARIANTFPELEIWLVDPENKKYQKTTWGSWLKRKKS